MRRTAPPARICGSSVFRLYALEVGGRAGLHCSLDHCIGKVDESRPRPRKRPVISYILRVSGYQPADSARLIATTISGRTAPALRRQQEIHRQPGKQRPPEDQDELLARARLRAIGMLSRMSMSCCDCSKKRRGCWPPRPGVEPTLDADPLLDLEQTPAFDPAEPDRIPEIKFHATWGT